MRKRDCSSSSAILASLCLSLWTLFVGCDTNTSITDDSLSNVSSVNVSQSAQSFDNPSPPHNKTVSELEKNKQRWLEKGITDYDVTASMYRGGESRWAEPVLIKVRNGEVVATECLDERSLKLGMSCDGWMDGYIKVNTVERMFEFLQKGYDDGATVDVKYDQEFGYPKNLTVNFETKGSDNWETLIVRKFVVSKDASR